MAAYVIYQGEVLDSEGYEIYKERAAASIAAAGGKYLVRGGHIEPLEGDAPAGRTVVLEFPNTQAALDWYHGEQYTAARNLRDGVARVVSMYVIDGVG